MFTVVIKPAKQFLMRVSRKEYNQQWKLYMDCFIYRVSDFIFPYIIRQVFKLLFCCMPVYNVCSHECVKMNNVNYLL